LRSTWNKLKTEKQKKTQKQRMSIAASITFPYFLSFFLYL